MNPDWLQSLSKSISAKIEGRNAIIFFVLAFCAFALYILINHYDRHPVLSWFLLVCIIVLAGFVAVAGLLVKPQPSEVISKYLIEQHGSDLIVAGGLQSHEALIQFLRAAHNIRELPPPVATIDGSAADPTAYTPLSSDEALELVRQDQLGVEESLRNEAAAIQTFLLGRREIADAKQIELPLDDGKGVPQIGGETEKK